MRILMVNYEYPPIGGGSGNATAHLLDSIGNRSAAEVDLVTSGIGDRLEWESPQHGLRIARLPVRKRELHYWTAKEIVSWTVAAQSLAGRMAKTESYDLCHCWSGWPSGLIGYRLRRRQPYLIAMRGSDVPGYNTRLRVLDALVFRWLSIRVWRAASRVTSVSRDLLSLARKSLPDLEAMVIYNGVDSDKFSPVDQEVTPFTLLFVGRLIERKGLSPLVEGFAELTRVHPGCRLVIVGTGPERSKLEENIRRLGIEDQVHLAGNIPHDELPRIYREATVFVSPSIREAMSNAILEAMASGLPSVVTRTGATELFKDNAVLLERADSDEIFRAALKYLQDPQLRARHGRNARRIAECLTWDGVADQYLDVYRKILREVGSAPT